MKEFAALQIIKPETEKSYSINNSQVQMHNYDQSVKNPNKSKAADLCSLHKILEAMKGLDEETNSILET